MNAPIVLFVYNRPVHTQETINALSKNRLIGESVLYVYADGPKSEATTEDKESISEVRKLIRGIDWCKSIEIKEFERNVGCRDIIIAGITEVLRIHKKVIVLEDDIITSPMFLMYMNAALDFYGNRKSVFSISAHSHSPEKYQIPTDYKYDVYVSPRIFNWGWGTWEDRWIQTDWDFSYYESYREDKQQVDAFCRTGDDLHRMLCEEYNGQTSAWDIQFTFAHFMNHAVSIVPCIPFTQNIGLDGSGTHCTNIQKVDKQRLNESTDFKFLTVLYQDKRIVNLIYSSFISKSRPLWQRITNRIARQMGYKNIFILKNKIYK